MIPKILKIAIFALAGALTLFLADKFKEKIPGYPQEDLSPGLNPMALVWFALAFIVSNLVLSFIGKKARIRILM